MTLRELSEADVKLFQKRCKEGYKRRERFTGLSDVDYSLAFSDGLKAALSRVTKLDPPDPCEGSSES